MKKNKNLYMPFLIILAVAILFLASQIPMVTVEPKDVPIGIVNLDDGEIGINIYKNLKENEPKEVMFKSYTSIEKLKESMNDREIYGALVIPQGFTESLLSLQSAQPDVATFTIYLNEGHNATIAPTVEAMLNEVTHKISGQVAPDVLTKMQMSSQTLQEQIQQQLLQVSVMNEQQIDEITSFISPIQPEQVLRLANPIEIETVKINKVGKLATVPNALFISVWISSLLGAVLFYMAGNKREWATKNERLRFKLIQAFIPILYGLFGGYVIAGLSTWILQYEFDSIHKVALVLAIAITSFVYLILAALVLIKMPALPIFGVLMFFGLPLIQLAPEMLSEFYQNYVLPWLPMRFLIESLKELLFFNHSIMNSYSIILISIGGVSLLIIGIKNLATK